MGHVSLLLAKSSLTYNLNDADNGSFYALYLGSFSNYHYLSIAQLKLLKEAQY